MVTHGITLVSQMPCSTHTAGTFLHALQYLAARTKTRVEAAARRQQGGNEAMRQHRQSNGKALSGTAARGPKRLRVVRLGDDGAEVSVSI